jgi:hypothetical protein
MSLAASGGLGGMGGGAGAGGLAMAHQAGGMVRPAAPNIPPSANIPMGTAPPSSAAAALGADLVDKTQQLSLKQVKDLSRLPLVAIDLYSTEPTVGTFPPKSKDPTQRGSASLVGKMKDKIALNATDASHKTFKKWLSKSKGYDDVKADCFAKLDDKSAVIIESPQQWLGFRRLEDAPEFLKKKVVHDDSTTPAIAEDQSQGVGVVMANSTLDGSVPQGDDFDRVVCKVRLNASKKALTVLPEEVLQLLLDQAQHHVATKAKITDPDDIESFPCCVAVPAAYCNDAATEALLDATGGTGVIFQRSVCALAGAVLPSADENKPNHTLDHLNKVLQARHKEFQKEQVKNPDARFDETILLLLVGLSSDSAECTAIEISSPQQDNYSCLYGNFKVLCSVSKRHENPESMITKCISDLFETLDTIAPEADVPVTMVSYGTASEQKTIHAKWEKTQKGLEDWEEVPSNYTKPDCVALGTAVLGAVSHGRLSTVVQIPGKKPKAQLAIQIQNVAPSAVGVRMNYHGGQEDKWVPVKTIFDFDRRVPAGPYPFELTAAEATVHRESNKDFSEDDLLKAIRANEGAGQIPRREEAALNLRVQVVQKATRDGEWKNIGDMMSPLVVVDRDDEKTACEMIVLELSLGGSGLITNSLVGDR